MAIKRNVSRLRSGGGGGGGEACRGLLCLVHKHDEAKKKGNEGKKWDLFVTGVGKLVCKPFFNKIIITAFF